jgi:hypothetical protein
MLAEIFMLHSPQSDRFRVPCPEGPLYRPVGVSSGAVGYTIDPFLSHFLGYFLAEFPQQTVERKPR